MRNIFNLVRICLYALSLSMALTACGGGKGGTPAAAPVDPSSAYTGVKTQARLTADNAENLTANAFSGRGLGNAFALSDLVSKRAVEVDNQLRLQQLAQVLNQSVRRLELPRMATERAQARTSAKTAKQARRQVTNTVAGPNGGSLSVTLDINDTTGSFYGSLSYHDYVSGAMVASGEADILGTFDANYQNFSRITFSVKSLKLRVDGHSLGLVGALSWGYNRASAKETLTINLVLVDGSKTYWWNNYNLITTHTGQVLTQTLAGRYYDGERGYLDFVTTVPMVSKGSTKWPTEGGITYSGSSGSSATLTFVPRNLTVSVDSDGNGSMEFQKTESTNDQASVNSAPTAAAGNDRDVTQNSLITLDGSASSDPEGDPLSYGWSFAACPDNICPSITDSATATPSFIPDRIGAYVLHLTVSDGQYYSAHDAVTINSSEPAPSNASLLKMQWQYGILGSSIGKAGLLTADLDADGSTEIVASASGGGFGGNTMWYVLRRAADGSYDQLWRSEKYEAGLLMLTLVDVTGDGKAEIVAVTGDGSIIAYNAATREKVRSLKVPGTLTAAAIADIDGDGKKEIVTSDGIDVSVYSAETGALRWSIAGCGGTSLAVGNVDGDAAFEIVTGSYGRKGYVIDAASQTVQWEYINGFGAQVSLADLDGDGMQEIVAAAGWYKITILDADVKTPAWEIATELDIDAVRVADIDGDGVPELLYGDRQSGGIHAVDVRTHAQKWGVYNSDGGISGIGICDVDRDGKLEILWGSGGNTTGADYLYIADIATKATEWKSSDITGPLSSVAVGDVDGDGTDEIVMVSDGSNSGYDEGVVYIFNAKTHALKYSQRLGVRDWMGVRSVAIGDVDGDGKNEYVITTADLYTGFLQVYDGATHTLKGKTPGYDGNYFSAIAITDVDGDGKTEIVAGQGREHTGAKGVYLIVFDGSTLQEKWRSVDIGGYWGKVDDIKVADLDGDGHQDIAALAGKQLMVYDGVTHELKHLINDAACTLAVADVDSDGKLEVVAGREDGKIDVFDGNTFTLKKTVASLSSNRVDALLVADLSGNGSAEWVVGSGGKLTVLGKGGEGLVWRSGNLSGNVGLGNLIAIGDSDRDGRKDLVVGSDYAVYQFERSP